MDKIIMRTANTPNPLKMEQDYIRTSPKKTTRKIKNPILSQTESGYTNDEYEVTQYHDTERFMQTR